MKEGPVARTLSSVRSPEPQPSQPARKRRAWNAIRCLSCHAEVRVEASFVECTRCGAKIPHSEGVLKCVDTSAFYEEAYLNRINHLPGQSALKDWVYFSLLQSGVFGELRRFLRDDAVVLDVGCASGVRWLGRYQTIGVDLSYSSLVGTRDFYDLAIQTSAERLPLASNLVDVVYSAYFFEHVPLEHKDACLRELYRCMKPGGHCVLLFDVLSAGPFGRFAGRDPEAFHRGFVQKDGHVGLEPLSRAAQRFEQAGFEVVKLKKFGTTPLQYMASYVWLEAAYGMTDPRVGLLGKVARGIASSPLRLPVELAITGFDQAINRFTSPDHATRGVVVARKVG